MFLSLSVFVFIGSQPFSIHLPEQHNRKKEKHPLISYRPFSSCLEPPSQSEAKCESIDKKMILYSHATATHFHKKGFALSLVLKTRVFGSRKRPITIRKQVWNKLSPKTAHVVSSFSSVFFCFVNFNQKQRLEQVFGQNTCNFTKTVLLAETFCYRFGFIAFVSSKKH